MRIINLVVLTREYPNISAGTKRIQHLIEQLLFHDINIKVLSLRSGAKIQSEKGFYQGIEYERIGSGIRFVILELPRMVHYYFLGFRAIFISRKLKTNNVIYCYGGLDIENLFFIIFSKLLGYKIIFDIVEDYTSFTDDVKLISKLKFWTVRKLDRLNVSFSNAIIVISTHLQRKYEKLKARNLTLITITAKTTNDFKVKSLFNHPFMIAYAGSFGDKDGVNLIIEGFKSFNEIVPDSILYLIGSGQQQKNYEEKYIGESGINFTGFLPDEEYYDLIQKADVLCMCRTGSKFAGAGFPFKLGEYLATGNPVVASKVSDVMYYLSEQEAYLIEPDNKHEFVAALLSIKNNPFEAFKIGLSGYNVCKKYFSPIVNSNLLYNILRKI